MHFYSVRHVFISNYELIVENLHVFFILISYNSILSCLRQAARKSIVVRNSRIFRLAIERNSELDNKNEIGSQQAENLSSKHTNRNELKDTVA